MTDTLTEAPLVIRICISGEVRCSPGAAEDVSSRSLGVKIVHGNIHPTLIKHRSNNAVILHYHI